MGNFKEKFKGAYQQSQKSSKKAKSTGARPDDIYLKLARTALRVGTISAILVFAVAFFACELSIIWSILLTLLAFILVQFMVGIGAAVLIKN